MMDRAGAWLFMIILPILCIGGGGWGLLTITPMTAGWLGCGIACGLMLGLVAHSTPVMLMDSGPEWPIVLAVPLAIVSYGFAVFCIGVFLWRGIGPHIDVAVH